MNEERLELGSGNVFTDLGFRDAQARLLKAELATKIAQLIESKGLTQRQIARRTGLDHPTVLRFLRGQLSDFSMDRLFVVMNRLGHSIEIRISANEQSQEKSQTRVMIA